MVEVEEDHAKMQLGSFRYATHSVTDSSLLLSLAKTGRGAGVVAVLVRFSRLTGSPNPTSGNGGGWGGSCRNAGDNAGRQKSKGGNRKKNVELLLLVGCLTSRQHARVSQGRICSDKLYVLPHWDRSEVADQTFYLTQSPLLTPGVPVPKLTPQRQTPGRVGTGVPILSHWYDWTRKKIHGESGNRTQVCRSWGARPTTRPTKRWLVSW